MTKKILVIAKIVLFLTALILLAHLFYSLKNLTKSQDLNDFSVYYQAASASLSENPYTKKYFAPYNYPPSATIFFLPFLLLPFRIAEILWILFSVFLFLFSVFIIFELFYQEAPLALKFLSGVLLLRTFPARFTLVLGQVNLVVLAIVILSFYFFRKKEATWAGFFLAIAVVIKLTPLMLVLFYLLKKEKRLIAYFFLTFLFLNLVSIILLGWQSFYYYFRVVLPFVWRRDPSRGYKLDYFNQSLESFLLRLGFTGFLKGLIRWLAVLFSLGLVAKKIVSQNKSLENFKSFSMLLIIASFFVPGFAWQHHYVFVFPALLILVFCFKKNFSALRGFLLLFFFLGFYLHFKDPNNPILQNPFLGSHHFLTSLALWLTLFLWR